MAADAGSERARTRFHGRVADSGHACEYPGCDEPGEFRAPPPEGPARSDAPPDFRWFCLDHVRAFNAGYNFFDGMTADEIHASQRPMAGWERETRSFAQVGDRAPRWADFSDPLEAIAGRFGARRAEPTVRRDGKPVSRTDLDNLRVLGLDGETERTALRRRYSELVRRYHPDRNGGDRSHEAQLTRIIAAYQALRKASAFA